MFGIDLESLIVNGGAFLGILIVALIAFAETAFLIGTILPGDSLLLLAGIIASQGHLPIAGLIPAIIIAAVLADNVAYSIGRRAGHRLFTKKDSLFFRQEYMEQAEKFYARHGGKAIIIARFVPVVRTFAPVIAGIGTMPRKRFLGFNIIGAALWGVSVTMAGYLLGSRIPNLKDYLHLILLAAVAFTFLTMAFHIVRDQQSRTIVLQHAKRFLSMLTLNKK